MLGQWEQVGPNVLRTELSAVVLLLALVLVQLGVLRVLLLPLTLLLLLLLLLPQTPLPLLRTWAQAWSQTLLLR